MIFSNFFRVLENDKKDNLKYILGVSTLHKQKNFEGLLKAFSLIEDENIKLKIVGSKNKTFNDVNLEKYLSDNRIEFLGKVNFEEIQKYYARADVFCRPSLSEGFGNVFIEAMANEVPVITTPVGGIPDFLTNGVTGWFCKIKDPVDLAGKINYVLDKKNSTEVEKIIKQAKKMVEEKYTWEIVAQQMKEIFNNLIYEK